MFDVIKGGFYVGVCSSVKFVVVHFSDGKSGFTTSYVSFLVWSYSSLMLSQRKNSPSMILIIQLHLPTMIVFLPFCFFYKSVMCQIRLPAINTSPMSRRLSMILLMCCSVSGVFVVMRSLCLCTK